jgi:D-alanyl-D-alanine carboxypeptidase
MNIEAVDSVIAEHFKPDEPGTAVAIIKDGEVIHRAEYGLANMEWGIPITPDTVFRLGSLTKQFTAVAVMMLQDQGKLRIDDLITKYIPDFPTSGHEVTIHHLLSSTSGIWSHTNHPDVYKRCRQDLTPREIAEEFWNHPFEFKPGTRWNYSNSGYILLGMIIEQVSGVTYADFMRTHLFEPLSMNQSGYLYNGPIVPKRASGYEKDQKGFRNAGPISMTYPYAGGALGSTLNDLILWDRALSENYLISADTLAQMHRSVLLADGTDAGYGYGWFTGQYRGMPLVHHGGGIHGFVNYILRFYQPALTVIMLTNRADRDWLSVAKQVTRSVLGLPDAPTEPVDLRDVPANRYAGTFEVKAQNRSIEITYENGNYYCKGNAITVIQPIHKTVIKPITETQFYRVDDPDNTLDFGDEVDGRFSRVSFNLAMFSSLIGDRVPEEEEIPVPAS